MQPRAALCAEMLDITRVRLGFLWGQDVALMAILQCVEGRYRAGKAWKKRFKKKRRGEALRLGLINSIDLVSMLPRQCQEFSVTWKYQENLTCQVEPTNFQNQLYISLLIDQMYTLRLLLLPRMLSTCKIWICSKMSGCHQSLALFLHCSSHL